MATLITGGSQLEIDGKHPRTAVIDSGASSIILGKSFSEQLARCRPDELIFGDTFVTAGGTTETCVGRTKNGLSFTLARGTRVETTIVVPVIIANTDAYDVILGMDFLGPLFAYVDPLTEEFCWRTDCHETGTMPCFMARLPAKCKAASAREHRYGYMVDVIESTTDLHDAILGDETKEETFDEVHIMDIDTVSTAVPIKFPSCTSFAVLPSLPPLTNTSEVLGPL